LYYNTADQNLEIMKNLFLSLVFVLVGTFAFSSVSEYKAMVSPSGCWAAADAAEINTCGSVGCNFQLWDAVFNACIENQQ
jgi:hypothetical protein